MTRKHPLYLEAVDMALSKFTYGDTITLDWLYDQFELKPPKIGGYQEFKKFQLDFLVAVESFKAVMLEEHKMFLHSVRGIGYRILVPAEQSDMAVYKGINGVQREVKKMACRLHNIDLSLLSTDEKQKHSDNLVRASSLSAMGKRRGLSIK